MNFRGKYKKKNLLQIVVKDWKDWNSPGQSPLLGGIKTIRMWHLGHGLVLDFSVVLTVKTL